MNLSNTYLISAILAITATASSSVYADEMQDMKERITALEEEINEIYSVQDEGKLEDERFKWGGFVSFAAEDAEDENSNYEGEIELFANMQLNNALSAGLQLELSGGGHESEEELIIEMEQAWMEYRINDAFKPTVGIMLMPWGRYNKNHFDPLLDLRQKPLVFEHITPGVWKEAGLGFSGRSSLAGTPINYEAYFINGFPASFTDNGGDERHGAQGGDNNQNKAFIGRVGFEVGGSNEIGLSAYTGKYSDDGESSINGVALDFIYKLDALELSGEYVSFDMDDGFVEAVSDSTGNEVLDLLAPDSASGFYLQASYEFMPKFVFSARYGSATIGDDGDDSTGEIDPTAVGVGALTTNDADNEETRVTFGLSYHPVESMRIRFERVSNKIESGEGLGEGDSDLYLFSVTNHF